MYKILKRLFDIIFSLLALIILSPVFLVLIPILLFTGEHEVFYQQQRIGYKNKVFGIWKFATMLKNSSALGTGDITIRNDPRVTKVGKFLRISKLNELPQLFNILTGEMSFVGPRPLTPKGYNWYSDYYREHVYNAVPGLTGIGSIIFRDEEGIVSASSLSPEMCYREVILPYKGELELWYQKHRSLVTDFKIILLTGWYVLFPDSELIHKVFNDLPARQLQP